MAGWSVSIDATDATDATGSIAPGVYYQFISLSVSLYYDTHLVLSSSRYSCMLSSMNLPYFLYFLR